MPMENALYRYRVVRPKPKRNSSYATITSTQRAEYILITRTKSARVYYIRVQYSVPIAVDCISLMNTWRWLPVRAAADGMQVMTISPIDVQDTHGGDGDRWCRSWGW